LQIFLFILSGIVGGIVGGMGMGGGTILVPILTLLLALPQRLAQAINLIVFLPVAVIATIVYAKQKLIDFSLWWKVSLPASLVAVISSIVSFKISNLAIRFLFAGFLIILSIWHIIAVLFVPVVNFICKKNN